MRKIIGFILIIVSFLVFYFTSEKALLAYEHSKNIPKKTVEKLPVISLSQNSIFYDRNNKPFYIPGSGENRINLNSNEIPQIVKDIFISTEDRYFYSHKGIDFFGVARAMLVNVSSSEIEQGASTITQQLARNLYLTHERSVERKLKEIEISLQLEKQFTKNEILEMYINTIYFANRNYGIEAASKAYFSRSVKDLTLAQTAFVCTIPNNPTLYDPLKNFEQSKKRQERILGILKKQGIITPEQYTTAMNEKITLKKDSKIQEYPDYYSYVDVELKQILSGRKGKFLTSKLSASQQSELRKLSTPDEKVLYLRNQGFKIYTSLNPYVQQAAVKAVNKRTLSTNTDGAAVVIQNDTHEIIAISGGRNYQSQNLNRAFQDFRQPGSTMKPLLVYAPYIETFGAHPDTTKVSADKYCKGTYCPQNDSKKEYGDVTMRIALQNSYNTAAIRLYEQLTPQVGFSYLNKFKFSRISQDDRTKLGSALGGLDRGVSPLEMTSAYSTFGNEGVFFENSAIQKITLRDGTVLYQNNPNSVQVYSWHTNEIMRGMLHSVVESGTARHIYMPLGYIGGKTGTTDENTNLWFMGLTTNYTVGTWIGNKRPSQPIPKNYSVPPPQKIWKDIVVNSKMK